MGDDQVDVLKNSKCCYGWNEDLLISAPTTEPSLYQSSKDRVDEANEKVNRKWMGKCEQFAVDMSHRIEKHSMRVSELRKTCK